MRFPVSERKTTATLVHRLGVGELTSEALVERVFSECRDPRNEAIFIDITQDRALAEARKSDERRRQNKLLGPWDGVPIAWKDLFDFEGHVTTAGSKTFLENSLAESDAAVVKACGEQGMISVGKTNLSEFAYSGLGLNPHFGTPSNPFSGSVPRSPGGSSSGSAAAVARAIVPVAVGTDTAGSVRVPASFCGLFGFKASVDRYPKAGCFPLSTTLDSFGGFAHCVDDLIALDALMRRTGSTPGTQFADLGETSFIVPQSVVFDDINPEVHAAFEAFVSQLRDRGASVRMETFPIFDEVQRLFRDHGTLTVAEAAVIHEGLLGSDRAEQMDQRVRARMLTADNYSVADYIKLQMARRRLQHDIERTLDGAVLIFPTVAILPPVISDLEASDDLFAKTNLAALRNTMIGSYLDMPGVTLPVALSDDGLPIGVLISVPTGHDGHVLKVAQWANEILCQ